MQSSDQQCFPFFLLMASALWATIFFPFFAPIHIFLLDFQNELNHFDILDQFLMHSFVSSGLAASICCGCGQLQVHPTNPEAQ